MNVVQAEVFVPEKTSQEAGILFTPAVGTIWNPLHAPCARGIGVRTRALTASEVVRRGIGTATDSVAYGWVNFGDLAPISGNANFGYLQFDGRDPIFANYTTGELPVCAYPCPVSPGTSFPNVRNGTHKIWNMLTVATDAGGANLVNVKSLVTEMQNTVDKLIPDFVPAVPTPTGDPGLKFYRSRYFEYNPPNNGLGGQKESGGSVAGCVEPVGPPPGVLGCRL